MAYIKKNNGNGYTPKPLSCLGCGQVVQLLGSHRCPEIWLGPDPEVKILWTYHRDKKRTAAARGLKYLLTWKELKDLIAEAGIKPSQIGVRVDQWQLTRRNDEGDYIASNSSFQPRTKNTAEVKYNRKKQVSGRGTVRRENGLVRRGTQAEEERVRKLRQVASRKRRERTWSSEGLKPHEFPSRKVTKSPESMVNKRFKQQKD